MNPGNHLAGNILGAGNSRKRQNRLLEPHDESRRSQFRVADFFACKPVPHRVLAARICALEAHEERRVSILLASSHVTEHTTPRSDPAEFHVTGVSSQPFGLVERRQLAAFSENEVAVRGPVGLRVLWNLLPPEIREIDGESHVLLIEFRIVCSEEFKSSHPS